MPYTIEVFRRDVAKEYLGALSPEEVIEALSPQQKEALRRKLHPPEGPKELDAGQSGRRRGVKAKKSDEARGDCYNRQPPVLTSFNHGIRRLGECACDA